jgi:hypothetical protein
MPSACLLTSELQYYSHEDQRPGGNTLTVVVRSSVPSTNETYHLIGDVASIRAVLAAVITNCSTQDTTSQIATFDRNATAASIWPEQAVQYYRAFSFAFILDGYNNTASLLSNRPKNDSATPPSMPDTPLPTNINTTLLACLNATIAFALPLVETDDIDSIDITLDHSGPSSDVIVLIVVGAMFGFLLLLYSLLF